MNYRNYRPRIAISWCNLPPYAARNIRAATKTYPEPIQIVASKPPQLADEVEKILPDSINWIDSRKISSWLDLNLRVPDIFFQSGWSNPIFSSLGKEVYQNNGKVICLSDNSWKNSFRQYLGAIVFRLKHKSKFHAMWVPGKSGLKLSRFYGMPKEKIYQGMYSSDPEVFYSRDSLVNRPRRLIFVGQLIHRKGLDILIKAFQEFHKNFPNWQLYIVGSGKLVDMIDTSSQSGIVYKGFQSPDQVAELMRQSRFLILPSYEEHWGLVVHEAALSGCGLILSQAVGSAPDLTVRGRGLVHKTGSVKSLYHCLIKAASFSNAELNQIYSESQVLASKFSPKVWSSTFQKIVKDAVSSQKN